jgi:hypothetical protein
VLLEIALDSGAAKEPVYFAFRAGPAGRSGHACLPDEAESLKGYDAVFVV